MLQIVLGIKSNKTRFYLLLCRVQRRILSLVSLNNVILVWGILGQNKNIYTVFVNSNIALLLLASKNVEFIVFHMK